MDFALLQVSCESISRIFFRVNAQTETVDAFEYPQLTISGSDASRLHNKTSFNTEETRGCRINRFSKCMKKYPGFQRICSRGAGMFSNKVDLMETLISWVVCRTLILLLRYSIVGTTIIL